jgi:hypothetical protein
MSMAATATLIDVEIAAVKNGEMFAPADVSGPYASSKINNCFAVVLRGVALRSTQTFPLYHFPVVLPSLVHSM